MPADTTSTPPIGPPQPAAEGVWIVEAETQLPGSVSLPIRMTVIRLGNGDLLLHSPSPFSAALGAELERLGPIKHLVAPSFAHWMFLREWQEAFPGATTWAAPHLRKRPQVRSSGVRLDHDLGDDAPAVWAEEIDQVVIRSGPFAEVAFFHRPSRTLVLTDLVQKFDRGKLPPAGRALVRLLGVASPRGGTPLYLRALLYAGRTGASQAATRLVAFAPERVIFAHGLWFKDEATTRLRQALEWLLPRQTHEFAGRTVVITGASSGIGRATALAFARRGAQLVLAARRPELLEALARECETLGARAVAATTDVTDKEAVERLAHTAETAFGGIDVWINNAGVGVFGPYHETDFALHRRTIEVNLMGTMHGAAAAIPRFLQQGSGVLINNVSLGAWSPTPFGAAYTASKFGLRGFTASLRQELGPYRRIHVCGVFPAVVDTPAFAHAANTSGRHLDPGPLLYRPEDVAEAFVHLVRHPRAETTVGWPAGLTKLAYAAAPQLAERVIDLAMRAPLARAEPATRTEGTLLAASPTGASVSGGWLRRKSLPSARVLSTAIVVSALSAGAAGLIARAWKRRA